MSCLTTRARLRRIRKCLHWGAAVAGLIAASAYADDTRFRQSELPSPLPPAVLSEAPIQMVRTEVVYGATGSIPWLTAEGGEVWLVESSGSLASPRSALLHVGPAGAERIVELAGFAFAPAPDREYVYLVLDKSVVRIARAAPHKIETLARNQIQPVHVAVTGDSLFWTNQSTQPLLGSTRPGRPGNVMRANRDGRNATILSTDEARELVVDADAVYYSSGISIRAVARGGGRPRVLVADTGGMPNLALDGKWLYFTREDGVSRVHTAAGRIEPVIEGITIPLFVAARNGWAFVGANAAVTRRGEMSPAQLVRVSPDHRAEILWEAPVRLRGLALGQSALYLAIEDEDLRGIWGGTKLVRVSVVP